MLVKKVNFQIYFSTEWAPNKQSNRQMIGIHSITLHRSSNQLLNVYIYKPIEGRYQSSMYCHHTKTGLICCLTDFCFFWSLNSLNLIQNLLLCKVNQDNFGISADIEVA